MPPDDCNSFDKGELTQKVADHQRRLGENDKEHDKMWETINAIRNRPPMWCTVVFGILLAVIGYLTRLAIAAIP